MAAENLERADIVRDRDLIAHIAIVKSDRIRQRDGDRAQREELVSVSSFSVL